MRRTVLALVVAALAAVACAPNNTASSPSGSVSPTAASCTKDNLHLLTAGKLTIATDNPAYAPWFGGDKSVSGSKWKANPNFGTGDPFSGQGYEGATAYAIATKLGFTNSDVTWVPINFNNSYKPGPKSFDFFIGQVSYSSVRAQAVDFSDGYYNVQQALVAKKGTPIANAKTFADLKGYKLGVQIGTTSYNYIVDNIQPSSKPSVYDNSNDVIAALNAGQIDGFLVDAPTAYVNVLIGEVPKGVVVGQFPTIGDQEHFGLTFEKGNALVSCANQAIAALKADNTLSGLQTQWLADITYPVITQS